MRWSVPRTGERRIIKRFALLPIEIDNEYVWLEEVYIEQSYSRNREKWINWSYSTKEEYIQYRETIKHRQ